MKLTLLLVVCNLWKSIDLYALLKRQNKSRKLRYREYPAELSVAGTWRSRVAGGGIGEAEFLPYEVKRVSYFYFNRYRVFTITPHCSAAPSLPSIKAAFISNVFDGSNMSIRV